MDLLDRVAARYTIDEGGCFLWTGHTSRFGYAQTTVEGRAVVAHRAVFEAVVGPVPEGLVLDHLCRVRNCINPDHLEPVTVAENNRRGTGWSGRHAQKTHCPKGHPYDEDNTYLGGARAMRQCRACHREHQRQYRAQKKAAS